MRPNPRSDLVRLLRDYFAGLAMIIVGAWLTERTGSYLPLALGSSAALMLTYTVVRRIVLRRRIAVRR